jgi:aryl-alcohol dehydrogenase-like predicted oxidoreductase
MAKAATSVIRLNPLGATNVMVSRLGLGMAALGRPGYINLGHGQDLGDARDVPSMEANARRVLDAAWAAGIRYFDAARSYGLGEAFLGRWLEERAIPPPAIIVGSKWGYTYTADWRVDAEVHEVKEHSAAVLKRQWRESSGQLGEYLRVYQIHSATFDSGVLDNQEVLDELARLKSEGIVIGLTLSGANQAEVLRKARTIERDGEPLFGCVQATWNLLEPSAGPALAEARAAGMGVIIKEALANGRLTSRNTEAPFTGQGSGTLRREAERLEVGMDALALAAALAQPWADIVLSGAVTMEQLRSNVRALDIGLDPAAMGALAGLAEDPATYWQTRSSLKWN